ncbi:unnamed protein product, partial [Iphiclides podalirius]
MEPLTTWPERGRRLAGSNVRVGPAGEGLPRCGVGASLVSRPPAHLHSIIGAMEISAAQLREECGPRPMADRLSVRRLRRPRPGLLQPPLAALSSSPSRLLPARTHQSRSRNFHLRAPPQSASNQVYGHNNETPVSCQRHPKRHTCSIGLL